MLLWQIYVRIMNSVIATERTIIWGTNRRQVNKMMQDEGDTGTRPAHLDACRDGRFAPIADTLSWYPRPKPQEPNVAVRKAPG